MVGNAFFFAFLQESTHFKHKIKSVIIINIQAHYPGWAATSAGTKTFPAQPNLGKIYQQVGHDVLTLTLIDNLD